MNSFISVEEDESVCDVLDDVLMFSASSISGSSVCFGESNFEHSNRHRPNELKDIILKKEDENQIDWRGVSYVQDSSGLALIGPFPEDLIDQCLSMNKDIPIFLDHDDILLDQMDFPWMYNSDESSDEFEGFSDESGSSFEGFTRKEKLVLTLPFEEKRKVLKKRKISDSKPVGLGLVSKYSPEVYSESKVIKTELLLESDLVKISTNNLPASGSRIGPKVSSLNRPPNDSTLKDAGRKSTRRRVSLRLSSGSPSIDLLSAAHLAEPLSTKVDFHHIQNYSQGAICPLPLPSVQNVEKEDGSEPVRNRSDRRKDTEKKEKEIILKSEPNSEPSKLISTRKSSRLSLGNLPSKQEPAQNMTFEGFDYASKSRDSLPALLGLKPAYQRKTVDYISSEAKEIDPEDVIGPCCSSVGCTISWLETGRPKQIPILVTNGIVYELSEFCKKIAWENYYVAIWILRLRGYGSQDTSEDDINKIHFLLKRRKAISITFSGRNNLVKLKLSSFDAGAFSLPSAEKLDNLKGSSNLDNILKTPDTGSEVEIKTRKRKRDTPGSVSNNQKIKALSVCNLKLRSASSVVGSVKNTCTNNDQFLEEVSKNEKNYLSSDNRPLPNKTENIVPIDDSKDPAIKFENESNKSKNYLSEKDTVTTKRDEEKTIERTTTTGTPIIFPKFDGDEGFIGNHCSAVGITPSFLNQRLKLPKDKILTNGVVYELYNFYRKKGATLTSLVHTLYSLQNLPFDKVLVISAMAKIHELIKVLWKEKLSEDPDMPYYPFVLTVQKRVISLDEDEDFEPLPYDKEKAKLKATSILTSSDKKEVPVTPVASVSGYKQITEDIPEDNKTSDDLEIYKSKENTLNEVTNNQNETVLASTEEVDNITSSITGSVPVIEAPKNDNLCTGKYVNDKYMDNDLNKAAKETCYAENDDCSSMKENSMNKEKANYMEENVLVDDNKRTGSKEDVIEKNKSKIGIERKNYQTNANRTRPSSEECDSLVINESSIQDDTRTTFSRKTSDDRKDRPVVGEGSVINESPNGGGKGNASEKRLSCSITSDSTDHDKECISNSEDLETQSKEISEENKNVEKEIVTECPDIEGLNDEMEKQSNIIINENKRTEKGVDALPSGVTITSITKKHGDSDIDLNEKSNVIIEKNKSNETGIKSRDVNLPVTEEMVIEPDNNLKNQPSINITDKNNQVTGTENKDNGSKSKSTNGIEKLNDITCIELSVPVAKSIEGIREKMHNEGTGKGNTTKTVIEKGNKLDGTVNEDANKYREGNSANTSIPQKKISQLSEESNSSQTNVTTVFDPAETKGSDGLVTKGDIFYLYTRWLKKKIEGKSVFVSDLSKDLEEIFLERKIAGIRIPVGSLMSSSVKLFEEFRKLSKIDMVKAKNYLMEDWLKDVTSTTKSKLKSKNISIYKIVKTGETADDTDSLIPQETVLKEKSQIISSTDLSKESDCNRQGIVQTSQNDDTGTAEVVKKKQIPTPPVKSKNINEKQSSSSSDTHSNEVLSSPVRSKRLASKMLSPGKHYKNNSDIEVVRTIYKNKPIDKNKKGLSPLHVPVSLTMDERLPIITLKPSNDEKKNTTSANEKCIGKTIENTDTDQKDSKKGTELSTRKTLAPLESGEDYDVDRIVGYRIVKIGSRSVTEYRIRWLGFSSSEDSWVNETNLNCPDILYQFWKALHKQRTAKGNVQDTIRCAGKMLQFAPAKDDNIGSPGTPGTKSFFLSNSKKDTFFKHFIKKIPADMINYQLGAEEESTLRRIKVTRGDVLSIYDNWRMKNQENSNKGLCSSLDINKFITEVKLLMNERKVRKFHPSCLMDCCYRMSLMRARCKTIEELDKYLCEDFIELMHSSHKHLDVIRKENEYVYLSEKNENIVETVPELDESESQVGQLNMLEKEILILAKMKNVDCITANRMFYDLKKSIKENRTVEKELKIDALKRQNKSTIEELNDFGLNGVDLDDVISLALKE